MNPAIMTLSFGAAVFLALFLQGEGGTMGTNLKTDGDGIGNGNQTAADTYNDTNAFGGLFKVCLVIVLIAAILALCVCIGINRSTEYASD